MNKTRLSKFKYNYNNTTIEPMIKGYWKLQSMNMSLEQN